MSSYPINRCCNGAGDESTEQLERERRVFKQSPKFLQTPFGVMENDLSL